MPPQILEDVTQDGSSFHWSRRSRHRPPYRPVGRAAGFGRLTVPGRYAETVDGSRIGARTTKALPVEGVSIPFWSRPRASVLARRAWPEAVRAGPSRGRPGAP